MAYEKKMFLLLLPGEKWCPPENEIVILSEPSGSTAEHSFTEKEVKTDQDEPVVVKEVSQVGVINECDKTTENVEAVQLEPPTALDKCKLIESRTPLPTFTDYVKQMLVDNKAKTVWGKIVNQAADYYLCKNPSIGHSSEYQSIGEKMFRTYPGIEHECTNPWALFCKDLSQRIRWVRWNRKKKSTPALSESPVPKKLFRVESRDGDFQASTRPEAESSSEDYQNNIVEMKKEIEKRQPNEKTIKAFIVETHSRRVEWIRSLSNDRIKPILDEFPDFEYGRFVMYEFAVLIGKDEMMNCVKIMVELVDAVEELIGEKTTDMSDEQKDNISMTKKEEYPAIVLYLSGNPETFEEIVIVGDECQIFAQTSTVLDGLMLCVAVYYIFSLEHPKTYSQLLGIILEYVMNEPYTGIKSKKFLKLQNDLNKKLRP